MTATEQVTVSTPAGAINYDPVLSGRSHLDGGLRVWWMTADSEPLGVGNPLGLSCKGKDFV